MPDIEIVGNPVAGDMFTVSISDPGRLPTEFVCQSRGELAELLATVAAVTTTTVTIRPFVPVSAS